MVLFVGARADFIVHALLLSLVGETLDGGAEELKALGFGLGPEARHLLRVVEVLTWPRLHLIIIVTLQYVLDGRSRR